MANRKRRKTTLEAVTTPLAFFALALLVVEGFIWYVSAKSSNPEWIWVGVGLFCFLVLIVAVLTWCKPGSLTGGERYHREKMRLEAGLLGLGEQAQNESRAHEE